ncbi:MAG TPA: M81 family metallopeptidase [Acetobacteraceae bacterium]|nr:M81 family metallopeptidase [Acetobacteraceae bacterium]
MRIGFIRISQETNDFNPVPTTLEDFRAFGIYEGEAILAKQRGVGEVGGYLEVVEQAPVPVETVPIISTWSCAGGRITLEVLEFLKGKLRAGLAEAGRLDGLALYLHGACAAPGIDDVDGELVALCRSVLGPVPIVLALDHHANVTQKMVANSTAIVGHRTQPHDLTDTGRIGAALLLRLLTEKLRPVMAWRKIPLISHQEQFLTARGPMKRWFDRARAMEEDPRVLQASCYPMQPWLDFADSGWACIVVTDGNPALADRLADELADLCWSMRDDFQRREAVAVDDAVRRADRAERGLVVLSDTGDTVLGGAAGDSNVLLEAMLRLGIKGPALVPLISPQAVARLEAAGEGARVTLPLGGEQTGFFAPLEVTGTVRKLADGRIHLDDGRHGDVDMGRVAVFETGPVTLLISALRGVACIAPDVYRAFGIEPRDYKMVVMKTASNFQYFVPIASDLIRADTKGPGQSDMFTLPWRRLSRPIYPLDPIAHWRQPAAALAGQQ